MLGHTFGLVIMISVRQIGSAVWAIRAEVRGGEEGCGGAASITQNR